MAPRGALKVGRIEAVLAHNFSSMGPSFWAPMGQPRRAVWLIGVYRFWRVVVCRMPHCPDDLPPLDPH